MGKHAPDEFKKQFAAAANRAMRKYHGFKSKRIQNLVRIEEINYDQVFDGVRAEMGQAASIGSARLQTIGSLARLGLQMELAPKLAGIGSRFGKDEFLYTHFLDVIFYTTLLGGKVRVDVARQLATLIANNPMTEIHIVAHSLGTAVVHDALALLYRKDAPSGDDLPVLDSVTHKLASIWMIANVSRLIYAVSGLVDPLGSNVRPGPGGCTNLLVNVRHEFDPFTWLARFDPVNDGSWIPQQSFDRAYRSIEMSSVRQPNTHDFAEAIEHPDVSVPLLRKLVRLSPSAQEVTAIANEYHQHEMPGAAERLRNAMQGIARKDRATLGKVASTARQVRAITASLFEQRYALAR
jgi:hypothetical protein